MSTPGTYAFDRSTKVRLCARAGINDHWVLHLEGRRLIVHRDPAGDGFRLILAYDEHEYVSTLAAPSTGVRFGEFLKYQRLPRGEMGHTSSMPVAVETHQEFVIPPHKLWTRDECTVLERSGLVNLDGYELIEGELIQKMPKGQPHILAAALLASWLRHVFGELLVVTGPTIDLCPQDNPTSVPEPDLIVLTRSVRGLSALARPQDLQLVAEVSSSSLAFDMTTKARLYARSGIQEYWVLDVEAQRLMIYREPTESGYGSIQAYGSEEFVSPLAAASAEVRVIDLLQ